MFLPSGESATAGKSGRSPDSAMLVGVDQLLPPSVEYCDSACSWLSPAEASDQASAISLVAPAPEGAPLARSTLGNESVRAPAKPSKVEAPVTGSVLPTSDTFATDRGFSNVFPPSKDRVMTCTSCLLSVPSQNTYTAPWLSVRIAHPCLPPAAVNLMVFDPGVAGVSCTGDDQVVPPSVERLSSIG